MIHRLCISTQRNVWGLLHIPSTPLTPHHTTVWACAPSSVLLIFCNTSSSGGCVGRSSDRTGVPTGEPKRPQRYTAAYWGGGLFAHNWNHGVCVRSWGHGGLSGVLVIGCPGLAQCSQKVYSRQILAHRFVPLQWCATKRLT